MLSATKLFTLITLAIILLEEATLGHALVRRYKFELKESSYTRLCTNKTILTINGQFPGPTIYARRGDLVIVDVINRADQIITIHWHGVKLPRYPWSDGAASVTQCPIQPGNRFTQRVILSDEEGTLWWHAHTEWSRNTVHGALVILPPKTETYPFPKPHVEVPILLGEWWNVDIKEVYEEFLRSGSDPAPPDAFLINGQPGNFFPCSTRDIYKLKVESGKTYLVRLINTMINNIMFFGIANHNITIVGSDGAYTKPFRSHYVAIAPGQTIDFLLEANQPPSRYYIASTRKVVPDDRVMTADIPTTGYVEYVGNYIPPKKPSLPSLPRSIDTVASLNFTRKLRSLADSKHPVDVPKNVTVNLFYTLAINLRPCPNASCGGPWGGRLLASINNRTLVLPTIPFLVAYYYNISGVYTTDFPDYPPFPYDYTSSNLPKMDISNPEMVTAVRVLEYNSTVELVLQGTNLPVGMDHPMHFHGYTFYVVGSGFGNFNRSSDPANYNLIDPPLMNTIAVPRSGWTAIRFKANNPGAWYLHCHFDRHKSMGMGMVFIVKDGDSPNEKMLPPPPDMPPCKDPNSIDSTVEDDSETIAYLISRAREGGAEEYRDSRQTRKHLYPKRVLVDYQLVYFLREDNAQYSSVCPQ